MKTSGIRQEYIEVDVTPITFLRDLFKHEFLGYDIYDDFKIDDNKLYVYIDTAYHGSPILEPRLISDDINKIKKFEALSSLIKLYDK